MTDRGHSDNLPPLERDLERLQEENRRLRVRLDAVVGERDNSVSRAEDRYRNIFEHSGDAIFCVGADGVLMDWNDAAARLFGYDAGEVIGRPLEMLRAADERRQSASLVEHMRVGETVVNREYWCNRKDGRRVRVAITCAPVFEGGSGFVGGSVIARDVTANWEKQDRLEHRKDDLEDLVRERTLELEEANKQLRQQDDMRALFIASLSHELRTPLNSILGFTDLLRSGMSGSLSEEQLKQVEIVHGAGQHLLAVINDVIDLSRIEAGQITVSREEFDLSAVIEEAKSMTLSRLDSEGVTVTVETETFRINSDPRRVKQIMLNLLSNAVKFTSEGEINIRIERGEHRVSVVVKDTGCGIAPEDLKRLFRPFQRAQGPARRPGAGLGLYLSKELAVLLGGNIEVESTPGVGSRFSLFLPA